MPAQATLEREASNRARLLFLANPLVAQALSPRLLNLRSDAAHGGGARTTRPRCRAGGKASWARCGGPVAKMAADEQHRPCRDQRGLWQTHQTLRTFVNNKINDYSWAVSRSTCLTTPGTLNASHANSEDETNSDGKRNDIKGKLRDLRRTSIHTQGNQNSWGSSRRLQQQNSDFEIGLWPI